MAPLRSTLNALLMVTAVGAFAPSSPSFVRQQTAVQESFGFDFAEDSYENTPDLILGEANLKQWVNKIEPNSFLNRQYNVVRRVRELNLLQLTADTELLSKLEKNGVDLALLEGLLPKAEELGLLSLVANNQQLLINGLAPVAIEGAPILLPVLAGALDKGPSAFYAAAAACAGLEFFFIANNVEVPLLGLPAGALVGLLLVPLTVVTGGLGVALSSTNKN